MDVHDNVEQIVTGVASISYIYIPFLSMQVQDLLLEYGLENVAETLIEGLSRVKRCTDEGRALMSLDLQVPFYFLFDDMISGSRSSSDPDFSCFRF